MKHYLLPILLLEALVLSARAQGPLPPPPGAPGPTMKTLDQIDTHVAKVGETRIPVDATHTPGDSSTHLYTITQPGSYYLTGNLTGVANKSGIYIQADNVTLDLNGFTLFGVAGAGVGIVAKNNVCIRNGVVRDWPQSGIQINTGGRLEGLIVSDNGLVGIQTGDNTLLSQCTAVRNNLGVNAANHCRLQHCILNDNTSGNAIGSDCTVHSCTASNNGFSGITSSGSCTFIDCTANDNGSPTDGVGIKSLFGANTFIHCTANTNGGPGFNVGKSTVMRDCVANGNKVDGIQAAGGSIIQHCVVDGNLASGIKATANCTVASCTSTNNGSGTIGSGIVTDIRARISDCTAIGNKADGIVFSGDSFVLNNHASTNGGAGFHDIGGASRIDGNVSRENTGMGIQAAAADTVVRNNSGANGGLAYGPTAGANWAPVGTANTATSPWANF